MQVSKSLIIGIVEDMLINSVNVLKDESYQRHVWFRKEGDDVSSYIDTIAHFLDNSETILEHPNSNEWIGEENIVLLKKLSELVRKHVDSVEEKKDPDLLTEDELLNDPKWHDIQMLADEVEGRLIEFLKETKP